MKNFSIFNYSSWTLPSEKVKASFESWINVFQTLSDSVHYSNNNPYPGYVRANYFVVEYTKDQNKLESVFRNFLNSVAQSIDQGVFSMERYTNLFLDPYFDIIRGFFSIHNFTSQLISALLFSPLFFGFIVLFFKHAYSIYYFSLAASALMATGSLVLWLFGYNPLESGMFQGHHYFGWFFNSANNSDMISDSLSLGVDGISLFFIVLTNIFIYLCIFSLKKTTFKLKQIVFFLFFLQWGVLGSFFFIDFLGFFIFFEATLIPIYFLVLIWGSRGRRIRASYLISIYTLFGSIFMFFCILYIYSKTGTTDYEFLLTLNFNEEDQKFLWIMLFISFAAKIPLLPLHIWLPEAHVEAPTVGSVLLAVLLLKLGTYGLIRFSLPLFPAGTTYFGPLVTIFAVLGIIYTSITAIRQVDLKKIIAYSSVGHMNIVLLGIISVSSEGLTGAIFQMLSHGVVSGALFFLVGIVYGRYSIRSLKYFGGLTFFYPIFATFFLIFAMANISFPLTSSFVGEFLIFMGLFSYSILVTLFAATSMVLGAIYMLWTYNRIFFGNIKRLSIVYYRDLSRKEFALFLLLTIFLFFMGICSAVLLDVLLLDVLCLIESAFSA